MPEAVAAWQQHAGAIQLGALWRRAVEEPGSAAVATTTTAPIAAAAPRRRFTVKPVTRVKSAAREPVAPEDADLDKHKVAKAQWRHLLMRVQSRKKWSDRGRLQNYAQNGVPKNLDGKPTGFGKHIGRWGWREIAYEW